MSMRHTGSISFRQAIRIGIIAWCACINLYAIPAMADDSIERLIAKRIAKYNQGSEQLYIDMESAIGTAINNSYELKVINASKKVYDLTMVERIRDFFPSLSIGYMRSEQVAQRETDTRQHKFSIDTNIVLFDGGKRAVAYDVAKLRRILARNDYRIATNKLIMEVMMSYFNILEIKGTIDIHKKTLEHGRLQLKFIRKELELGEATRFDVMEIEAKVKGVELELEKAVDNYLLSLNKFKLLLKIDYRQSIELIGDIENDFILYPLDSKVDIFSYINMAVKNRKEVESSDAEYLISKKANLVNQLYFLPQLSVGFNYSLSGSDPLPNQFLPREKGWGINFKVTSALFGNTVSVASAYDTANNNNSRTVANSGSLSILDSMDYRRKIVESQIDLYTNASKKKEVREVVSTEVLSSIMELKNSWNMIDIAKKQLVLYDNQLKIERLKANMGESRRYDLMKKEIERGEAAISHLDSKVRYLSASSTLELSMGVDIGFLKLSKLRGKKQ